MLIRQKIFLPFLCLLLFLSSSVFGKVITVNTTNNVSPAAGETNLVQAIALLANGDSIHFNIPGPGPFYLVTPPLTPDNGYPAITNHNVTIDGYSQPGSSPNSNTILSSNNANIKIVIDTRNGGGHVEDIPGFETTESAALFVNGATNATIRGLCFLGPGLGLDEIDPTSPYAIAFGSGAGYGHVNGNRFGLDLDGKTVYRFRDAVAGFQGDDGVFINGTTVGVDKTAGSASVARGQFNIIIGEEIPVILEGDGMRIAGNYFNVFPDGLTDFNVTTTNAAISLEAFIEIGLSGNNVVLGTDSDGMNDEEERNIFGGVAALSADEAVEFYNCTCTNLIIAGNYFGVGIDGETRFTNRITVFAGLIPTTTARIGSDLDGVEDALEANLVSMNYPFDTFFPYLNSSRSNLDVFLTLNAGSRISFRGNKLMGNNLAPVSYASRSGNMFQRLTNVYGIYLVTTNLIFPTLSTNSSQARLRGICSVGKAPYTNLIIDVYYADPEGWTNGQRLQLQELAYTNPITSQTQYYGFAQGKSYIGSFVDNGPEDLDPTPGQFEFDISRLNLPTDTLITATANYSADAPGTHNGRTETTDFAMPITLQATPRMDCERMGNALRISWPTNAGSFVFQSSPILPATTWTTLSPQPAISITGTNYTALVTNTAVQSFYRLAR